MPTQHDSSVTDPREARFPGEAVVITACSEYGDVAAHLPFVPEEQEHNYAEKWSDNGR